MSEFVVATLRLYREALRATLRSFLQCWMIAVAVVCFAVVMMVAVAIAGPLGILGGFLLGAVNALLIGATLGLVEQAVVGMRRMGFQDILSSFGRYFWDVIGVGFVLWVPLLLLERGMAGNPNGPLLVAAVFFVLFLVLNPAPEIIYQVRHDSPLDVIRRSYEFVIENWIEWFLPLAVVLAPFGLSFFFGISARVGRMAGLDFFQLLSLPFTVLGAWMEYLGLPDRTMFLLGLLLTPPAAAAMMIFRGHLFAALHGTSRRQRLFKAKMEVE